MEGWWPSREWHESVDERLDALIDLSNQTLEEVKKLAIDQATFDNDLSGLVTAINNLDTAVDAWVASHPDLTAEDQQVQAASAAVAAELAKITPAPAPPGP